jgi:hypothetical protein
MTQVKRSAGKTGFRATQFSWLCPIGFLYVNEKSKITDKLGSFCKGGSGWAHPFGGAQSYGIDGKSFIILRSGDS